MAGLGFFPAPLDDELAYSMLARYRACLGTESAPLRRAAFGPAVTHVGVLMPGGLCALARAIPEECGLDAAALARRHTVLPYYAPFLPRADHARVLRSTNRGWARGEYGAVGLFRSTVPRHHLLNFCPSCAREDVALCGMAGWKRSHQLPGVFVCHRHGTALRRSALSARNRATFDLCPTGVEDGEPVRCWMRAEAALRLARTSGQALGWASGPVSAPVLASAVLDLLGEQGWVKADNVRRADLCGALAAWLGVDADVREGARRFGAGPKALQELYKPCRARPVHPLRYLLVLSFLGKTPADLMERCAEVGRTVRRAVPRRLRRPPAQHAPPETDPHLLERSKERLLAWKGPIRRSARGFRPELHIAYNYLRRHDPAWLKAAVLAKSPGVSRRGVPKVEWAERDAAFATAAAEAVRVLLSAPGRPRRVTKNGVVKRLGAGARLRLDEERLPRTAAVIRAAVEDDEAIARRRVEWAAEELRRRGEPLTATRLGRLACLGWGRRDAAGRHAREAIAALVRSGPLQPCGGKPMVPGRAQEGT